MKTSHILQRYYLFLGNNIDVVQNVPCHFEQSEKSRKRLMQSSCQRANVNLFTNSQRVQPN